MWWGCTVGWWGGGGWDELRGVGRWMRVHVGWRGGSTASNTSIQNHLCSLATNIDFMHTGCLS